MGAASGISEPILFSVTEPRLPALLTLVLCLASGLGVALLLFGPRYRGPGWVRSVRVFLAVCLLGLSATGVRALLHLASPTVLLKATERGLTSYMVGGKPNGGLRLQLARHADTEGLFVPWRAMASLGLDTVDCYAGGQIARCDVLAIALRPGFQELREGGVVVPPGGWRSTLDLSVPIPPGGPVLLAELRALQQRFGGR